jgi:hypothetical protein
MTLEGEHLGTRPTSRAGGLCCGRDDTKEHSVSSPWNLAYFRAWWESPENSGSHVLRNMNVVRVRPVLILTVSSRTSRSAACQMVSPGSTPPPGNRMYSPLEAIADCHQFTVRCEAGIAQSDGKELLSRALISKGCGDYFHHQNLHLLCTCFSSRYFRESAIHGDSVGVLCDHSRQCELHPDRQGECSERGCVLGCLWPTRRALVRTSVSAARAGSGGAFGHPLPCRH